MRQGRGAGRGTALAAVLWSIVAALPASAGEALTPAVILQPEIRGPAELERRKAELHALLTDTAGDLQLSIALGGEPVEAASERNLARIAHEQDQLIVLPTVRALDDERVELRIVAARPDSKVLSVRVAEVAMDELDVRAVVMLRDVVRAAPGAAPPPEPPPVGQLAVPVTSEGRFVFAVNGTLYGGFVGYSLQRASGSDDPRLLYPLVALGAGVGLGATLIVADEWDVDTGDAWYLAGAWWPAVAGHLLYEGRFGDTSSATADEAWSFGLVGSLTGITVATTGLISGNIGDSGAVFAHSGGALGLMVGGLADIAVSGDHETIPFAGMGYGAASGWLLGSAAAMLFKPSPGRLLLIDLGIVLGGLAGASAASPLLFDEPSEDKTRGWVAAAGGGMIAGGVLAGWLTSPDDGEDAPATRFHPPLVGPLPLRAEVGELDPPAYGIHWSAEID